MVNKKFVCTFPGGADAGSLSIGDCGDVNGIGIVTVKGKKVVIAVTEDRWGLSILV